MIKLSSAMFLLGVMLLVEGCSGSKSTVEKEWVWPSPPDAPRIKFVKTYQSDDDFKSGLGKSLEALGGGKTKLTFARPFDVTGDNNGRIVVSDGVQGVFIIDEIKQEFRLLSCPTCEFPTNKPRGIACDTSRIFVGLPDLGQIVVFSYDGKLLDTIGARGSLPNPIDVVLDQPRHRLLVVDNRLHQVKVYRDNGDTLLTIGRRGSGDGEFNFPQSLTIDKDGNIYVVDAFNFRIQVFDSNGNFLRKFGKQGDVWGTFAMPKGIALDSDTNIYVLDSQHEHFQIFNNQGQLLLYVGDYSTGNDGFINPVSMFIDRNDFVYVTDQLNRRVQVFKYLKQQ